ncbi:autotransporter outer membrane beta-barrel domain-containing protein, partial [Methanobrevibacter sp.]
MKSIFIITLIFTLFLGLNLVSASDTGIDDTVSLTDNNIELTSNDCDVSPVEETNIDANENFKNPNNKANDKIGNGEIVKDSNDALSLSSLNYTINSNSSSVITLENDYEFDYDTDYAFVNLGGIVINRDVTIDGKGHSINLGSVLRFINVKDHSINLKNLNIVLGYTNKGAGGGAVYISGGTASFTNCSFSHNSASNSGGAVYIENGNGIFINTKFDNNDAFEYGGAVQIYNGTATFKNATFLRNFLLNNEGGAVSIFFGNGNFINSSFVSNGGNTNAGAVYIIRGNGSFEDSIFEDNKAKSKGGAVYITEGNVRLVNSSFTSNNAEMGGAIYLDNSNSNFTDCLFKGNNASAYGGAVYIGKDAGYFLEFINTKYLDNNAGFEGSGVYFDKSSGRFINSSFIGNENPIASTMMNNIIIDQNTIYNSDKNLTNVVYMNASVNNLTYGSTGLINITFFNTEIINEGVVYVVISNRTYVANVTNNNAIIYLNDLDTGVYNLNVIFNGTTSYFKTFVPVNFVVKRISNINVSVANITYGEDVLINVTTDCADNVVYVEIDGKIYYTNLTSGKGIIRIPGLHRGIYTLNVTYNETEEYYPCTESVNFTVSKADSTINVSAANVSYGEDVLINVTTDCQDSVVFVVFNGVVYSTNLTDGKGVIRVPGLEIGSYDKAVTYNGTSDYFSCVSVVHFKVNKHKSSINVSADDVVIGEDVLINITTDCPDSLVYVEINGVIYSTNLTGGKGVIRITGLHGGSYNLNVTYNGTEDYSSCVKLVSFNVNKLNSTINVSAADVTCGHDVLVNVTTACPDSLVYVEIDGVIYSTNLTGGKGIIRIPGLHIGAYNLNVTYNGTEDYSPCVELVSFNVKKTNSTINVSTTNITYGEDVLINITTDCQDSIVYVEIDGTIYSTNLTDGKGVIRIPGLHAKSYNLNVTYNGTEDYLTCTEFVNFTVLKANSTINVSATNITYGEDVLINVTSICPDGVVFVEIDGVVYSTNLTGGKGVIRIAGLHARDYNLNVTYNGTEDYLTCTEFVNFTVFKTNSTINVSAEDVLLGDNVLINVTTDCPD